MAQQSLPLGKPKKKARKKAPAGPGGKVQVKAHTVKAYTRKRAKKLPQRTAKGKFKKG